MLLNLGYFGRFASSSSAQKLKHISVRSSSNTRPICKLRHARGLSDVFSLSTHRTGDLTKYTRTEKRIRMLGLASKTKDIRQVNAQFVNVKKTMETEKKSVYNITDGQQYYYLNSFLAVELLPALAKSKDHFTSSRSFFACSQRAVQKVKDGQCGLRPSIDKTPGDTHLRQYLHYNIILIIEKIRKKKIFNRLAQLVQLPLHLTISSKQ